MAIYRAGFETCPIDDTLLSALESDPLVGTTIADQYAVDSCVGEGAMGRVYLAHHVRLTKRRFAIKVLLGDLAADPTMRLRFGQEAEAASRLQHPNVVSVLDFGTTKAGLHYLVMDFIEGGSLCDRIDAGALSERDTIDLTKQICLGLTHAHEQGLVHRDFKPDNVALVEHDGKLIPKILDFGLAIISTPEESSVRLTTAGLVVGTPAYVSPEQSQAHPVDLRTDLFALGVSLYEMLSGKLPFDGSVIDVLYKNATVDAPPIAERAGIAVAPELEAIITKLMAKAPDDRFASAREVLAALEAITNPRSAVVAAAAVAAAAVPQVGGLAHESLGTAQTMTEVPAAASVPISTLPREAGSAPQPLVETALVAKQKKTSVILPIVGALVLAGAGVAAFVILSGDDKPQAQLAEGSKAGVSAPSTPLASAPLPSVEKAASEPIPVLASDAGAAPALAIAAPDAALPSANSSNTTAAVRTAPIKHRKPKQTSTKKPEPARVVSPKPEPAVAVVVQPKPEPAVAVAVQPKPEPAVVVPPKPKVPTSFKAAASLASFDSHGSLSDSKVKQTLNAGMGKLTSCYEPAARSAKTNAALSVHVKYVISENGRIEKVSVSKAPLPGLSDCIAKTIKKFRPRDRPDTGPQRVQFTLKYKPKK